MVCAKCGLGFANPKEMVKCSECGSELHPSCSRIRTAAKLAGMSAKAVATWRCDECAHESASVTSRSDSDDPTILELLRNISREMADSKRANSESFASLQKSLGSMQESLIAMNAKMSAVEAENAALRQECVGLRANCETLSQKVNELGRDVVDLQQYTRCSNLEIRGVPYTTGEDIYAVLVAMAKALEVPFNRHDISIAHRLRAPRDKRFQPNIVVQFTSRSTRGIWLAAAKKRKLQTTDLVASLTPGRVYVSDHLSTYNKDLLRRARSYVRDGKLAYAWSVDGRLLVRKAPDSPAIRVWTVEDVERAAGPRVDAPARLR